VVISEGFDGWYRLTPETAAAGWWSLVVVVAVAVYQCMSVVVRSELCIERDLTEEEWRGGSGLAVVAVVVAAVGAAGDFGYW
jgi:hypothetical protein